MLLGTFFSQYVVAVPFVAWLAAQIIKISIGGRLKNARSIGELFQSGGMPSAHCAFMLALTTAILMKEGIGSSLFALSLAFAAIVVYDAIHVRRESGIHAQILNAFHEKTPLPSAAFSKFFPLEIHIGHEVVEAACGSILGVLIALLCLWL